MCALGQVCMNIHVGRGEGGQEFLDTGKLY